MSTLICSDDTYCRSSSFTPTLFVSPSALQQLSSLSHNERRGMSKGTHSSYGQYDNDSSQGPSTNLPSMSTAHPNSFTAAFSMVGLVEEGKYKQYFTYPAKEENPEVREDPPANIVTKIGKSPWDKNATLKKAWTEMGVADNVKEYDAAKSQARKFEMSLDQSEFMTQSSVFWTVIESLLSSSGDHRSGRRRGLDSEQRSIVQGNILEGDFPKWLERRRERGAVLPQLITLMEDEELFEALKWKYDKYEEKLRARSKQ